MDGAPTLDAARTALCGRGPADPAQHRAQAPHFAGLRLKHLHDALTAGMIRVGWRDMIDAQTQAAVECRRKALTVVAGLPRIAIVGKFG